jgi:hypothetical protein
MVAVRLQHAYGKSVLVLGLRLESRDDAEWIRCSITTRAEDGESRVGDVLLTPTDIDGLLGELDTWQLYGQPLEFESTDGTLICQGGDVAERPELYFQCFLGEPHEILRGCRVVVTTKELDRARNELTRARASLMDRVDQPGTAPGPGLQGPSSSSSGGGG